MKYLLILVIMMMGPVVNSDKKVSLEEPTLISQTNIYINENNGLLVRHWVVPPYFENGAQVEYKLFEKFVLEHNRELLHYYIDEFKDIQDSIDLTNPIKEKDKVKRI